MSKKMKMDTIAIILAIAVGGACGAVLRYGVYSVVDTNFPWATFIVNIISCSVASYLMFHFFINGGGDVFRNFLFVGFFGALSTMSTFSIDMVKLIVDQAYALAAFNFVINCVICILCALGGYYLATL